MHRCELLCSLFTFDEIFPSRNEGLDDLLNRYDSVMKDGFEEDQRISAAYAKKDRQTLERLFSAKPLNLTSKCQFSKDKLDEQLINKIIKSNNMSIR